MRTDVVLHGVPDGLGCVWAVQSGGSAAFEVSGREPSKPRGQETLLPGGRPELSQLVRVGASSDG